MSYVQYIASIEESLKFLKRHKRAILSTISAEIHIECRNNHVVTYLRMRKSIKIIKHICVGVNFSDLTSNII